MYRHCRSLNRVFILFTVHRPKAKVECNKNFVVVVVVGHLVDDVVSIFMLIGIRRKLGEGPKMVHGTGLKIDERTRRLN